MIGTVYCHFDEINEKVYVGQTWGTVSARFNVESRSKYYLGNAIRKHGKDAFGSQILGQVNTQIELDNLEKVWIILLQATDKKFGYNVKPGGSRGRGYHMHTEEFKQARRAQLLAHPIRSNLKGVPKSSEHIKNQVESRRKNGTLGNRLFGKPLSEEHKLKISRGKMGHIVSQATRDKTSATKLAAGAHA